MALRIRTKIFEAQGPTTCYDPATNPNADFVCIGPLPGSTIPFQTYRCESDRYTRRLIFLGPSLPCVHQGFTTTQQPFNTRCFRNSVITVSYVGSRGQNLLYERSLNNRPLGCYDSNNGGQQTGPPVPRATTPPLIAVGRLTRFSEPTLVALWLHPTSMSCSSRTMDISITTRLQASFRQRNWHGINTQYNFTWSNCIDNNSTNRGGAD